MTRPTTVSGGSLPVVALATCAAYPSLTPDDRLLANCLEGLGFAVSARVWREEEAWKAPADLVVIRSCWDYHLDFPRFLEWLDTLERRGHQVVNRSGVLKWNAHKSYLEDLNRAGIASGVPTVVIRADEMDSVESQLRRAIDQSAFDWSDVVAKAAVSGTAWETYRLRPLHSAADMEHLIRLVRTRNTIVQPFVYDVVSEGELSLVYFGGTFSHAVAKRPASSDFRVQEEHGGSVASCIPPAALEAYAARVLAEAARIRSVAPADFVYARVDVVNKPPPRLMELELIEPSLFLGNHPLAPARFAAAIAAVLSARFTG